jgi:hypothetical protein
LPLFKIGSGELPVFLRFFDPGKKPAGLFLFGNIQEQLHHTDTVMVQILFIVPDIFIAVFQNLVPVNPVRIGLGLPHFLDPLNQHFLVM